MNPSPPSGPPQRRPPTCRPSASRAWVRSGRRSSIVASSLRRSDLLWNGVVEGGGARLWAAARPLAKQPQAVGPPLADGPLAAAPPRTSDAKAPLPAPEALAPTQAKASPSGQGTLPEPAPGWSVSTPLREELLELEEHYPHAANGWCYAFKECHWRCWNSARSLVLRAAPDAQAPPRVARRHALDC